MDRSKGNIRKATTRNKAAPRLFLFCGQRPVGAMLPRVKPPSSIRACRRLRDRMPSMFGLSSTAQILLVLLLLTVQACDDSTADNYGRPGPCVPKPILFCDDPLAYNFQAHVAGTAQRSRHFIPVELASCES